MTSQRENTFSHNSGQQWFISNCIFSSLAKINISTLMLTQLVQQNVQFCVTIGPIHYWQMFRPVQSQCIISQAQPFNCSMITVSSCGVEVLEVLSGLEKRAKTLDIHMYFCGFFQCSFIHYFFLSTWGCIYCCTGSDSALIFSKRLGTSQQ